MAKRKPRQDNDKVVVNLPSDSAALLREMASRDPELQHVALEKIPDSFLAAIYDAAHQAEKEQTEILERAAEELTKAGLPDPGTDQEGWDRLARTIGKDPAGMSLREILDEALAWADRKRIEERIRRESTKKPDPPAGPTIHQQRVEFEKNWRKRNNIPEGSRFGPGKFQSMLDDWIEDHPQDANCDDLAGTWRRSRRMAEGGSERDSERLR